MTVKEIEAFFLDHDSDIYEQIQEADTEDEAEGIADDALTEAGKKVEGRDLIEAVRNIRDA